jgi:hypothetical protein
MPRKIAFWHGECGAVMTSSIQHRFDPLQKFSRLLLHRTFWLFVAFQLSLNHCRPELLRATAGDWWDIEPRAGSVMTRTC